MTPHGSSFAPGATQRLTQKIHPGIRLISKVLGASNDSPDDKYATSQYLSNYYQYFMQSESTVKGILEKGPSFRMEGV